MSEDSLPEPEPQLEEIHPNTLKLGWKKHLISLATVCLVAGVAFSLFTFNIMENHKEDLLFPTVEITSDGDKVSEAEQIAIESTFMRKTVTLQPVNIEDDTILQRIITAEYFNEHTRKTIQSDIENGEAQLIAITLWDNFDQDGDVVQIQSGGVTITVPLAHAPTSIFIPYKPSLPLIITGLHDGGGGITTAVSTNNIEVPLPLMAVGQSVEIPIL